MSWSNGLRQPASFLTENKDLFFFLEFGDVTPHHHRSDDCVLPIKNRPEAITADPVLTSILAAEGVFGVGDFFTSRLRSSTMVGIRMISSLFMTTSPWRARKDGASSTGRGLPLTRKTSRLAANFSNRVHQFSRNQTSGGPRG
jgi:hypothetical protein